MKKVRSRIVVRNFRAEYEDFIALEIKRAKIEGNIIAIVGHNGAGKSTLIKSILDLMVPAAGTLHTDFIDERGKQHITPARDMAFCPENGSVFADITVENYVKLWCRIKHRDAKYYRKEGSQYVDLLNLNPLLPKIGRELSKGQRRRVQTAIGFLCEPKFFLFDEPFDGLDVQKTTELSEIIETNSSRMSFLVSSHRMDVVERLADVVVVLSEGKIATYGPVEQVCKDLCRQSIVVSNLSAPSEIFELLKRTFPDYLINHVGNQIRLTGDNLEPGAVKAFLKSHDTNGFHMDLTDPGLVDAMNYHLRALGN
jgi:ABC-2 type transport system ATP-binding protein